MLLDDWAPDQRELSGEDAITELAWSYIRSHGPVPATDFAGWAGIPVTQARRHSPRTMVALSQLSPISVSCGSLPIFSNAQAILRTVTQVPRCMGASGFDEFMLGYKDRRHSSTTDTSISLFRAVTGCFGQRLLSQVPSLESGSARSARRRSRSTLNLQEADEGAILRSSPFAGEVRAVSRCADGSLMTGHRFLCQGDDRG